MARIDSDSLPPILYRGSVKDVHGVKGDSQFVFVYSDRYSVFDWGEMPDKLPGKGAALASIADSLFNFFGSPKAWQEWSPPVDSVVDAELLSHLRKHGLSHHSKGLRGPAALVVDAVDVIRPAQQQGSFDYSAYARRPEQALLPLEVIFRLGLPEGSSFRQRAAQDRGVLEDAGLTEIPSESTKFSSPVIEFSTKLEPTDRPLRHREAQDLAGLSEREFKKLINLTSLIALRLKSVVEAFGAELWDGKLEFAFTPGINHERDFRLVDSIGPDELRILRSGIHLSKESLRQVYRGSEWYRASLVAKEVAACENSLDWKSICRDRLGQVPLPLTPDQRSVATQLYPALAEAFTAAVKGERLKAEVALDAVVEGLRKVRSP